MSLTALLYIHTHTHTHTRTHAQHIGFPSGSDGKESACNAGDPGLITGFGRSPGLEDPLEKGVETYSNIPAWKIPWTEEPGGL